MILIITILICAIPFEASAANSERLSVGKKLSNIKYEILAGTFDLSYWCWAACAVMMASDSSTNYRTSQSSIVSHILGSVINQMATVDQSAAACTYATYNTVSYSHTNGTKTLCALATHLYLTGAVEIIYSGGDLYVGHACVIDGYDISGSEIKFDLIDPADGSKTPVEPDDFMKYDDHRQYGATVWH